MTREKTRRSACAAVALACALIGVAAGSGQSRTIDLQGPIGWLHADGGTVAIATDVSMSDGAECGHALAWLPVENTIARLPTRRVRAEPAGRICDGWWAYSTTVEVATGNGRAAWLVQEGGNTETDFTLVSASLERRVPVAVLGVSQSVAAPFEEGEGDHIGLLQGDGGLLTFHTWTEGPYGETTDEQLWRINGKGQKVELATIPGIRSVAVDAGRIAVLRDDATIQILDGRGTLVSTLPVPGEARSLLDRKSFDLALSGGHVAVLKRDTLDVLDLASGQVVRSWRLPDAEPEERGVLDLSDGVVTFLWNGRIQLLRIADGRSTEIDQAHESGCSGTTFAQLEEIGLFYAFSSICSGKEVRRVTFLPADDVARAFDEDTGARAR